MKERVKNVLHYRSPSFRVIVVCLIITVIVSVCFLTDPPAAQMPDPGYGLIQLVVEQAGYTITGQESKIVNLVLEKDKLPDSCFTKKGHTFQVCEVIPYQSGAANRLYLQHAGLDDADPSYVRFTFAFQTDALEEEGKLLLPYRVDIEGNGFVCDVAWRSEIWDNRTTYSESADAEPVMYFEPVMNGEGFCILVKADICQQADHQIAFMLKNMNLLSYEVTKPTAPVSISLDNISPTGLTMLFHQDEAAIDGPLKTSNDFFLEENVDGEWLEVPTLMQPKFREDALDVSTLHHYGIDWTNLYGSLPDGHYRIAKPVPVRSNNPERVVLYAEFTLSNQGISLTAEDVTPTGMTLFYHPEDTLQNDRIITDEQFWLEVYSHDTAQWSVLEPTVETIPGYPDRNIRVVHDLPRGNNCLVLDWFTCYGELPIGRYRAATQLWFDSEPHTYYAEFYVQTETQAPTVYSSSAKSARETDRLQQLLVLKDTDPPRQD